MPPAYTAPTPTAATGKHGRDIASKPSHHRAPCQDCSGQSFNSAKATSGGPSDYELEQDYNLIRGQGQGQVRSASSRTYVAPSEVNYLEPLSAHTVQSGNTGMPRQSWRQDEYDERHCSIVQQQPISK